MTCFRLVSGETLRSYCIKNGYSYEAVRLRIEKGQSVDEALKDYLPHKGSKANHCKHFYKGQNLYAYFKQNVLLYYRCLHKIYKGMTIEQAIKAVER